MDHAARQLGRSRGVREGGEHLQVEVDCRLERVADQGHRDGIDLLQARCRTRHAIPAVVKGDDRGDNSEVPRVDCGSERVAEQVHRD